MVLANRIIDRGVAIHPDRVVVIVDGAVVTAAAPLAVHCHWIIEYVAQTEHTTAAPALAQILQSWLQFPDRAPRPVVHDQDVRVKGFERGTDRVGSQRNQLLE